MSCIDSDAVVVDRFLKQPAANTGKIDPDIPKNPVNCLPRWALLKAALIPLIFLAACTTSRPPAQPYPPFAVSKWEMLPDWQTIDLQPAWAAFWQSCTALKNKPGWQTVCTQADQMSQPDNSALHQFFEQDFTPYQVYNPDGTSQGLFTGYYEPKLYGSPVKTARFRYPLYGVPDDLLTIDLGDAYPQLKDLRLRGRLQGNRVVPYYNRSEIDSGEAPLKGHELFWVDNAVDLFFLQIQGSGRIELPDGSVVKVGYADQNGYPYTSIGKKLVEMGGIKLEDASMQGIKDWAAQHPDQMDSLLEQNASYVFFRILPDSLPAPLGALGVPLTDQYSLAVDPRTIPLGAPVFISTTYPNSTQPLNRLMLAQDTGGAIKGAVRGDFYWGFGAQAGAQAGSMKQTGEMWVLFPKGAEPTPSP
ncbi:MAG: MltA domain-containing protein [Gallionella sp.]|nr:MltA domain-containing protein [Gallionella sp.]